MSDPSSPTVEQLTDVVVTMARAMEAVLREQQALTREMRSLRRELTGEVRSLDERVGALSEDMRIVRALRDGLAALASDVDAVRQLSARAATSQQMAEVIGELSMVLREIETAKARVLELERAPAPPEPEVVTVTADVEELGRRIDQLADVVEHQSPHAVDELAERLRRMSQSARQLGNGVLADLRSRRKRRS